MRHGADVRAHCSCSLAGSMVMRSPSGVRRSGKRMPGFLCCGFGGGADSAALSASALDIGSLVASAAAPAAVCLLFTELALPSLVQLCSLTCSASISMHTSSKSQGTSARSCFIDT